MPRTPRTDRPPSTNGRHEPLTIEIHGESAEKIRHLAEKLGTTPEIMLQAWVDTHWPPVPAGGAVAD